MNSKAGFYFDKNSQWYDELALLRTIVLDCGLTEDLKWGCPCYTFQNNNIVLIHVFKQYCALLFFKGSLLNNNSGLLIQQTKNVQAARQIRFTNLQQISAQEPTIKAHIYEAIEVEKAGLEVVLKKTEQFPVSEEFRNKLDALPSLKTAFYALTRGRQRGYLLHFSQPKQSKTREARVERSIPNILIGKGLED